MQIIAPTDLLPLDLLIGPVPFAIDLVYARSEHPNNHFPGLYHPQARLFAHRLLVPTLLRAARLAQRHDCRLQVLDCFRPIEAQVKMAGHGYLPELIMPPGQGGHPRGLAVDVQLLDDAGHALDMGTPFDFFASDLDRNPAARDWPQLTVMQQANRALLDDCMFGAAAASGLTLEGLPQEWWDYRLPQGDYERFAPLHEADLPAALHMTAQPGEPSADLLASWHRTRDETLASL